MRAGLVATAVWGPRRSCPRPVPQRPAQRRPETLHSRTLFFPPVLPVRDPRRGRPWYVVRQQGNPVMPPLGGCPLRCSLRPSSARQRTRGPYASLGRPHRRLATSPARRASDFCSWGPHSLFAFLRARGQARCVTTPRATKLQGRRITTGRGTSRCAGLGRGFGMGC